MQTLSDRIFRFHLDCVAYHAVKAHAAKNKIDLSKTCESLIEEFRQLNVEVSDSKCPIIKKNMSAAYEMASRCIDIKEGEQNGNNCV